MCRFIESIKAASGALIDLPYHQERVNRTFADIFPMRKPFDLAQEIKSPHQQNTVLKCRVIYDDSRLSFAFTPYEIRKISSLKIIECPKIHYSYKFENRFMLDQAFAKREDCDDIIIIQHGLVTDSYYANLVFSDGQHWYTPESPLLKGTKRQQLIDSGIITTLPIARDDIKEFKIVSLINSMLDLATVSIDSSCIY